MENKVTGFFNRLAEVMSETKGVTYSPWGARDHLVGNWFYETSTPLELRFPTVEIMSNVYKEVYGVEEISVRDLMNSLEKICYKAA